MRTWLLLFFVTLNTIVAAQSYSKVNYEAVVNPANLEAFITIVQDKSQVNICGDERGKYGFRSQDQVYIPELTSITSYHWGGDIKFKHFDAGIFKIKVYSRKDNGELFDDCEQASPKRTSKTIYVLVKPPELTSITLPVGGDPYYISNIPENFNQENNGECSNRIETSYSTNAHQYIDELNNFLPRWDIDGVTFNPQTVGTFTITPNTRYVDAGTTQPCMNITYFDVTNTWTPIPIIVENFTWKSTPPIICINQGSINLASYFNISSGVTFSGTGVSGTTFNPLAAGVGKHFISAKKKYSSGDEIRSIEIEVVNTPQLAILPIVSTCNDLDLRNYFTSNIPGGSWAFSTLTEADVPTPGISGVFTFKPSLTVTTPIKIKGVYTVGGCSVSQISKVINVIPGSSASLTINNSTEYCQAVGTVPLTLTLGSATATTTLWSGNGVAGTSLDLNSLPTGLETTVSLVVTTSDGCTLNASKKILVKPSPILSYPITEVQFCNSGQIVDLQTSFQPKDGNNLLSSGSWTSSNPALLSKISGKNLSLTGLPQGSYPITYTFTNSSGCQSSTVLPNSIKVFDSPKVDIQLNVAPNDVVCSSTNFTLSTETVNSNLGINWFSPSGYFGGTPTISTGTLSTGEYIYRLFVNNNSNPNCVSENSVILYVNNPTPLSLGNSNLNACQGYSIIDLNTLASPNYDSGVYTSTNSAVQAKLSGTWKHKLDLAGLPTGNYPIKYNARAGECILTKDINLSVTTSFADPVLNGNTILCQPSTTQLNVSSPNGSLQYRWYTTLTNVTPFLTATSYTTPVLETPTQYYLEAYNTSTKCSSSRVLIDIKVQRMDTVAMYTGLDLSSCTNTVSFNLNRPEVRPLGGTWSGPGISGSTFIGNSLANNKAYAAVYAYTQGLCTKRDTLLVTLGIDLKPQVNKRTVYSGELLEFDHNYPSATSTQWNFGDGMKSVDRQTGHYYYRPGYKNVTLTITVEQNGSCSGTITMANFINVLDTFSIITGSEDPSLKASQFSTFPNPFKEVLNISSERQIGKVKIALISMDGRVVYESEATIDQGNQELIPSNITAMLPEGVYVIRLIGAGSGDTVSLRVLKL